MWNSDPTVRESLGHRACRARRRQPDVCGLLPAGRQGGCSSGTPLPTGVAVRAAAGQRLLPAVARAVLNHCDRPSGAGRPLPDWWTDLTGHRAVPPKPRGITRWDADHRRRPTPRWREEVLAKPIGRLPGDKAHCGARWLLPHKSEVGVAAGGGPGSGAVDDGDIGPAASRRAIPGSTRCGV